MRSGYALQCGPLNFVACQERASEIEGVITDNFPLRAIRSIEIVNEDGHAHVVLDDGTEIGFGERL